MALTYGFYNSIGHDRKYDAVQFGQVFDGIIQDGIYETYKKAMIVKESNNDNQVIIQPGRAWFDHTWSYNDSNYALTMPSPESFLDRIDAVVLDINAIDEYRRNTFQVISGDPGEFPFRPSLIKEDRHKQYPLCYIYRHGGQNHIYQGDITNAVGTSECPFVVGVINGITIDELILQWDAQLDTYIGKKQREWDLFQSTMEHKLTRYEQEFFAWMEGKHEQYYEFLEDNNIAWTNWFKHIQHELDGDVAGHLQTQIDDIKRFTWIYTVGKTLFLPMSGATVEGKKLIFAKT